MPTTHAQAAKGHAARRGRLTEGIVTPTHGQTIALPNRTRGSGEPMVIAPSCRLFLLHDAGDHTGVHGTRWIRRYNVAPTAELRAQPQNDQTSNPIHHRRINAHHGTSPAGFDSSRPQDPLQAHSEGTAPRARDSHGRHG